mmetsp:Transcript_39394/g.82855  ORF Transcript_39394/g.82855 Transcript_39394/m.82855 type:complete len:100 (+) Transcript_39394:106-405(+)
MQRILQKYSQPTQSNANRYLETGLEMEKQVSPKLCDEGGSLSVPFPSFRRGSCSVTEGEWKIGHNAPECGRNRLGKVETKSTRIHVTCLHSLVLHMILI